MSALGRLVGSERKLIAKFVLYLGEVEERRLHLRAGFSSMFEFCKKELGLSDGEAFRRILAARLGRRFPIVQHLLASGAVNLTALELVRGWLTDENHAELLDAVSGKSKHAIEALLGSRFPKPDVPSTIRKLPSPQPLARITPLSETRFRVEFTASAELREKLELCRDLMSHANPSRDLGAVVERAVDLLLADLERKRLARTKRSRPEPRLRQPKQGRIANATRRRVFERDGLQCTYVSPDGRRCEARAFLELDHVEPRALGGRDDPENLRVRCRAHNQLAAEQVFGRDEVERRRHFRQQKLGDGRAPGPLEKVRLALTGMGFHEAQARRAIAEVERLHCGKESPTTVQALREALVFATTAVAS
jgi:5-methylcytosine-specific restriction endonuclease McrA